jgi:hypothetical protein
MQIVIQSKNIGMAYKIDFSKIREYKIQEFYWIEFEIYIAIQGFKEFIRGNEENIIALDNELKKKIREDLFLNSDEEDEVKSQYYSQFFENDERVIENLKYIQRNSIFLMGYSLFESKLREICLIIEREIETSVKVDDLKGDSVGQYWNYLTKVIQIDIHKLQSHYTPLKQLKEFRNKVAHQGNFVTKVLKEIIEKNHIKGLKLRYDSFIIDDLVFFDNLFKNMKGFFEVLMISIDDKLKGNR